ncbi:hypothetical protein NC651_032998 [Populus alba x Populus x berolinensis]|nr:hypothetical protein NC651_032998 [Populus alba x Populus x berolinensis]
MANQLTRVAIVTSDRCKLKKCRQECKKSCPVVKTDLLEAKGRGFHFPSMILLDCPLDLSALTIFDPVSPSPKMDEGEQIYDFALSTIRQKILKSLICAQPWYKTPNNLHLWDPSSIDLVLISSTMGCLPSLFLLKPRAFLLRYMQLKQQQGLDSL